jgi:hypothetical protein
MSIEVMKQALEALDCIYSPLHVREIEKIGNAMAALRAAIEQGEKPVAWVEPEFWSYLERSNCGTAYRLPDGARQPLYTTPPAAPLQWVGLTDREKEEATGWSVEHIEAKLKEKNAKRHLL